MTRQTKVRALRTITVVLLFGAWWYGAGPGGVAPFILPTPTDVARRLATMLVSADLWHNVGRTAVEIALSGVIAASVGLLFGFFVARSRLWSLVCEPLLAWGYIAPLILFYPIFILWFGVGMWSKVAITSVAAFFPVAYNALRGFMAVDPRYLRVGRAFKASRRDIDREIKFHAAMPLIVTGIRVGSATSFIIVIVAEMLASDGGLGYMISRTSTTFDTIGAYSAIIVVVVAVIIFQLLTQWALRSQTRYLHGRAR